MTYINKFFCILTIFVFLILSVEVNAQGRTDSYELLPAPDIWYNDVDGIRVGVRLLGQVPGTFGDGPHRLDFGLWLGTWIPEYPVSYYLSFIEPIPSISGFGSEGNIQLISSIRTGFHLHGLAFNKRWQVGFDENNFRELTIGFFAQDRFENEYVPYPQLWQNEWLYLINMGGSFQNENALGRYRAATSNFINVAGNFSSFINSRFEFQQLISLGNRFSFRGRLFSGISSGNTAPEFLFMHSMLPAINWMESGFTRAKGTIPMPWLENGFIQVAGGANLRGYLEQDIEALNTGQSPVFTSIGALNLELDYPNPLDRIIQNIPVVGGLMNLRSYLFFDSGTSLGITPVEESRILSDAGFGFMLSFNIPDYLGKQRGITIRYDVPLWLSHPSDENHFEYRNLIGISAVISL